MEFTLNNIDIFNINLPDNINQYICKSKIVKEDKYYKITIEFHVNSIINELMLNYFNEFVIDDSYQESSENSHKEVIYKVLSHILTNIETNLENYLNIYKSTIKGCVLTSENIIVIKIKEGEPAYFGRGKNRRIYPIKVILPDARKIDNVSSEKENAKFMLGWLLKENLITNYEYSKAMHYLRDEF
jgi:hypothetical protein